MWMMFRSVFSLYVVLLTPDDDVEFKEDQLLVWMTGVRATQQSMRPITVPLNHTRITGTKHFNEHW